MGICNPSTFQPYLICLGTFLQNLLNALNTRLSLKYSSGGGVSINDKIVSESSHIQQASDFCIEPIDLQSFVMSYDSPDLSVSSKYIMPWAYLMHSVVRMGGAKQQVVVRFHTFS